MNRLLRVSAPSSAESFDYDHAGRRISKFSGGLTTQYLYDAADLYAE
ncbi:MAG TPA: hypothetical protein VFA81_07160 [Burkholderiales bacterium]|nr:hypothetical protein [Burkholderiales bacterium]